jgi:hypothetical protein
MIDFGGGTDPDDDLGPTDGEVSKYSFFQRLIHYMDGNKIDQQNRKAVELAILVEAGTVVRNMDPMKKATREQVLLRKYIEIIQEIEDGCFEDATIRCDMLSGYKGGKARQGLSGANLLRKLEREMTDVRKFAVRFPGVVTPHYILHPSFTNFPHICVNFDDMLVVEGAKLWPVNTENAPIEIGDALEGNSRVAFFPLCSIEVACRTSGPFYMDNVHRSTCSWQAACFITTCDAIQFGNILWKGNVLIPHIHECIKKHIKNL